MDSVVKVDEKLLKEIEKLISKNKYLYSSKKQVVNLAIIEFLNSKSLLLDKSSKKMASKKRKK